MVDEPLDPLNNNPAPRPTPEPRPRYLTCDYCGCQLTQGGEVYKMSDAARTMNKHGETIVKLNDRIAELEREISGHKARIAELTPEHRSSGALLPTFD